MGAIYMYVDVVYAACILIVYMSAIFMYIDGVYECYVLVY